MEQVISRITSGLGAIYVYMDVSGVFLGMYYDMSVCLRICVYVYLYMYMCMAIYMYVYVCSISSLIVVAYCYTTLSCVWCDLLHFLLVIDTSLLVSPLDSFVCALVFMSLSGVSHR